MYVPLVAVSMHRQMSLLRRLQLKNNVDHSDLALYLFRKKILIMLFFAVNFHGFFCKLIFFLIYG